MTRRGEPEHRTEAWQEMLEAGKQRKGEYNPVEWANKRPKRLYHTTRKGAAGLIIANEEFRPLFESGEPNDFVYMSAAAEELLGNITLIFNAEPLLQLGFSPRTYLPDQSRTCGEKFEKVDYVSYGGYDNVPADIYCGCIPEPLWDTYPYPDMEYRCQLTEGNKNSEGYAIDQYGANPMDYRFMDKGVRLGYQATFVRTANDPIPISLDWIKAIAYNDASDVGEAARSMGREYGISDVITMREATERYPELTDTRPPYHHNSVPLEESYRDQYYWSENSGNTFPFFDRPSLIGKLKDRRN